MNEIKVPLQGNSEHYKAFATLSDCEPYGHKFLKITSICASAKDPEEERVMFTCMLDKVGVANLRKLLSE